MSDMSYIERGSVFKRITPKTSYVDPHKFDSPAYFKALMYEIVVQKASDVFVQPGYPISATISGHLHAVTQSVLDENEVYNILKWATDRDTAQTDAMSGKATNARFEVFDPDPKALNKRGGRIRYGFRVNASPIYTPGGTGVQIVLRRIPSDPPVHTEIGLPEPIIRMMTPKTGIVIVAGGTSTGKTTTFASVIRFILENETPIHGNLISHEDPIEYIYDNIISRHSIYVQSQIPTHFRSFADANEEAMRRAPRLINIGEIRDKDSIESALEAAKTGHPVFGTLHSNDVSAVISRLVTRYPESMLRTATYDICHSLRFVMAQKLVPSTSGGQVACREYLPFNRHVRDLLALTPSVEKIKTRVNELLHEYGHSFTKDANRLLAEGLITEETRADLLREEAE